MTERNPTTRRNVLRKTGGIMAAFGLGGVAVGSASAQGPPDEFPGSETGEENSENGRDRAEQARRRGQQQRRQRDGSGDDDDCDDGDGGPPGNSTD